MVLYIPSCKSAQDEFPNTEVACSIPHARVLYILMMATLHRNIVRSGVAIVINATSETLLQNNLDNIDNVQTEFLAYRVPESTPIAVTRECEDI